MSNSEVLSASLGFPRVGANRELKKAQESYWKGKISAAELQKEAANLRRQHWEMQKNAGINIIPSNDFTLYDHVLDTAAMVGAVPERYGFGGGNVDLDTFFAMARGSQGNGKDVVAMEMTKWFDTNYHYIVPELKKGMKFKLSSAKAVDEFKEAKALGIITRPVLVGPVTFLMLGKCRGNEQFDRLELLPQLLEVYGEVLAQLKAAGAESVQLDEPILVTDIGHSERMALQGAYEKLAKSGLKIALVTYFGALEDNLKAALSLPIDSLHVDLVRAPGQLDETLSSIPDSMKLSLGLVNGRNIWKTDLTKAMAVAEKAVDKLGKSRVIIAPSCSLLHSPVDADGETALKPEVKNWLAFAKQKLQEVVTLKQGLNKGKSAIAKELAESDAVQKSRSTSKLIHNEEVKQRLLAVTDTMMMRGKPFDKRIALQDNLLKLPLLPTTTIGSLPQTEEIRQARARLKSGEMAQKDYDKFLEQKTAEAIKFQEEVDIDVPVHGEYERNDMVEYFGEQLEGFTFTKNGWVQSYGSRCVKPPVIFGDVSRPKPMTVRWSKYAQSLTKRPVKGMLTGPVTILQWSFVRDDQSRESTCKQIALAIRDEVVDLEQAGIRLVQIDEPAIREGLPLRKAEWKAYLRWAVDSFRLSASGVKDDTQIHTHMCYSEFNDIIASIGEMDADVISIETSRSAMELLDAFVEYKYPNQIGPGVYDIHSPRVPNIAEMEKLLDKALKVLSPEQIWVNPDCGLKTRGWAEVKPALENMVKAAKQMRGQLSVKKVANG
jgi:5-methyltetrahydropteroyltriglutamate--homocysteine methyltransferase